VQTEHGDDGIVYLEQQTQAVALVLELLLHGLSLGKIERVIYGHGDLPGYLLQKDNVDLRVGSFEPATESESAEFSQCRRDWNDAEGHDAVAAQPLRNIGKSCVVA
jgi:hypothetical protein